MSSYTASGARRMGDEYQDLQSAEVLIEWLEQLDAYRWVRLETTAPYSHHRTYALAKPISNICLYL